MYFYKKDNNLIILYKEKIYTMIDFDFTNHKKLKKIEELIIKKYKESEVKKQLVSELIKGNQSFHKLLSKDNHVYFLNEEILYLKAWNEISIYDENIHWNSNFNIDVFFDNESINRAIIIPPIIKRIEDVFCITVKIKNSKKIEFESKDILECFFYICKQILSQLYGYNSIGIGRDIEQSKEDYLLKTNQEPRFFYQDQLSKELGLILAR